MPTLNDELIEEFALEFAEKDSDRPNYYVAEAARIPDMQQKLRTILTQKDAEVTKREQELIEQICTIVKDGIDDWWSYQVTDKIKALTPHPTEDTSGKSK